METGDAVKNYPKRIARCVGCVQTKPKEVWLIKFTKLAQLVLSAVLSLTVIGTRIHFKQAVGKEKRSVWLTNWLKMTGSDSRTRLNPAHSSSGYNAYHQPLA